MKNYVIDKIIEKAERSTTDWRRGAAGNRSFPLKDYHEKDYLKVGRSEFASQVRALELEGLVQCRWYESYSEVQEIKYQLESLQEFYRRAGRREKNIRVELLTAWMEQYCRNIRQTWIQAAVHQILERLQEGKIPVELKTADAYLQNPVHPVDNWTEQVEKCGQLDLFLVLRGLDELEEPVYKRLFSSRYLKDRSKAGKIIKASKVFEECWQDAVIALAKVYHPFVEADMDNTQILSQLFIEEYAQVLALKGELRLKLNQQEINLSPFVFGTVLNSQTLKHGVPAEEQTIRKVITVENQANYESMTYEAGTLIIFCHGYFTPKEREFLKQLYETLKKYRVEYYHTGDMDYGGVRIFQYIRQQIFPELKPLYMDVEQYERFFEAAEPLEESTLEKLQKIREPQLQPLIDRMLQTKKGIEQESFLP